MYAPIPILATYPGITGPKRFVSYDRRRRRIMKTPRISVPRVSRVRLRTYLVASLLVAINLSRILPPVALNRNYLNATMFDPADAPCNING